MYTVYTATSRSRFAVVGGKRYVIVSATSSEGFLVTARRIASAVLATAIPSVCPNVRLSHAGVVSKRRHVARCSLHCQIANVSSFVETKYIPQGRPLLPEILAPSDLPSPDSSES